MDPKTTITLDEGDALLLTLVVGEMADRLFSALQYNDEGAPGLTTGRRMSLKEEYDRLKKLQLFIECQRVVKMVA